MKSKTISARISIAGAIGLMLVFLLGAAALPAGLGSTEQFTVEMKMSSDIGASAGKSANVKYYVGENRIRMDVSMPGVSEGGGNISVFEGDQVVMYMLIPQMKQYMKTVGTFEDYLDEGPGLIFGSPDDADHPCQSDPEMTCEKIGTDVLAGRSVDKYRVNEIDDGVPVESEIWIDQELKFPLRMANDEGLMEATSVVIGAQTDELFEIPAGYTEMTY